ncbi:gpt [Symbiodinium natans]|uniref:Gpt protein n=1 Tax=Symbiodinium natans TaxID=878477 RepID=A0A812U244_9DINO|nr:gpt [Symbiodinium natans]
MEIRVDAAEGFATPKDTFLSMRIGDFQKQSRFGTAKTYKFPKMEDPSGLARIEVFQRVGHLTLSLGKLHQSDQSVEVPVDIPGMSHLPLRLGLHGDIPAVDPDLSSQILLLSFSGDSPEMEPKGKNTKAHALPSASLALHPHSASKTTNSDKRNYGLITKHVLAEQNENEQNTAWCAYLASHHVEEVITDAIREVIREKPAEPLAFLSTQILKLAKPSSCLCRVQISAACVEWLVP